MRKPDKTEVLLIVLIAALWVGVTVYGVNTGRWELNPMVRTTQEK